MHYVSGHEVAQNLMQEVYQLAFAPTTNNKAWIKRKTGLAETYITQANGLVAYKAIAEFNCSPEMMLHIVCERQLEWDLNARDLKILEEYDSLHQILLLSVNVPFVNRIAQLCLFRCKALNNLKREYFVTYQSIDHEIIHDNKLVLTCAPSGFFLFPVEGEPNKCKMIKVLQFHSESQHNPVIVENFCTSSDRIVYNLTVATETITRMEKMNDVSWENAILAARKQLHNFFHEVNEGNGWTPRFQLSSIPMYTRESTIPGEQVAALRGTFSLPYPTEVVSNMIFESIKDITLWDAYVSKTYPIEMVTENAYILRLVYSDLSEGQDCLHTACLISRHIIQDNYCDITSKVFVDRVPRTAECIISGSMPVTGYIVGPTPNGPSVIQWMSQTTHPPLTNLDVMKRVSARVINHINGLFNYVSKKLKGEPQEEYPVSRPDNSFSYLSTMDAFVNILNEPSTTKTTPQLDPTYARRAKGKRKSSAELGIMNVEDMVLKDSKSQIKTRPFLFLVSGGADGNKKRYVRRRLGTSLTRSNFDLLPQELLQEILLCLDSSSLSNVAQTCHFFKVLVSGNQLWRTLYLRRWGNVSGRLARRYAGDDEPATFFTPSFPDWKNVFLEQKYIEDAWRSPERRALTFSVTKAHSRELRVMALMPSRHRLITGSRDRLVRVWDVMTGACLIALQGSTACVGLMAREDQVVKLGYKDGVVRFFDVVTEECNSELHFDERVCGFAFSKECTVTWNNTEAMQWDEKTQQRVRSFMGHTERIKTAAINDFSGTLFTASRDNTVALWDMRLGTRTGIFSGHSGAVNGISFIGENICVSASSDSSVKIWDIRKISSHMHELKGHNSKVRCVQYSEVGKKICTGGDDAVCIWQSEDFSLLRREEVDEPVLSVAMDEERLAFGGENGRLKFYDYTPHS